MAYDKENEATVVISRRHHNMLVALSEIQKRKIRATIELAIEQAYKARKENGR